jgi:hypothetical protein
MSGELHALSEHQPQRRSEVIARLDQIAIHHRLAEWAEAITGAFVPLPDDEHPCDTGALDDITDRLDELSTHLQKLEGLLVEHLAKPRWTVTVARWSITITRGGS